MRQAAADGDASYRRGFLRSSAQHSVKRTGVLASHPFMKVLYWNDLVMRAPDPMHTIGNEVKAIMEMLMGGTGKVPAYSAAQLPKHAHYECEVNERWRDLLAEHMTGETLQA